MEELLKFLQDRNILEWNWALIGDGSGTTADKPYGSACVLISHFQEIPPTYWFNCGSAGTNNWAEASAYLPALNFLAMRDRPKGVLLRVVIVTDSEYTAQGGSQIAYAKANFMLFAAYEALRRIGIAIQWIHQDRETLGYNKLAHDMANLARKTIQNGTCLDEATSLAATGRWVRGGKP